MTTIETEAVPSEIQGTVQMVRPQVASNWTGMDLIPFETIAERFLDLDHEGQQATLTVSFGKPFPVGARGWACPYRISALGRDHITPAGGADSVHALQMAMHMVHNELTIMARHHKISFLGADDLGFSRVGSGPGADPAAKCPVVGMGMSVSS